ncbi:MULTISPECIES: M48 family metalloprotease [unclassified Gilliamella]|uniref:M48 family metalloprotease n=1 Tax=unclassified Gilliamella TaxID=2685620 RepID=UPI002269C153|nr:MULTISPECIES: M48 family metalloprotease [unclassified Gilliamella]MCX8602062.1 M48 family metalloprotease [Gilliamella sp. B3722]MCX8607852.1 M48 family metalloprotease [Gilliamella sp. B3771]MCX8611332.1 M48 family metalloprotease [Gilliamella sp. B3891]MCX8613904.1 M48 family metalloprotease [Gilliamella sp. B3773]MCX8616020.1 M48 family metalloprotease [Gilliamella sp. B3770]
MKPIILLFLSLLTFFLFGCQTDQTKLPKIITAEQIKALSENDLFAITTLACIEIDDRAIIAADNHKLTKRLNAVAKTLPQKANNIALNYKVYIDTQPNAWSTANGCIRVNSGLMKLLDDNELQAVLAHEQAHVALKHTISLIRQAPYIEFTNKANELVILTKEETAQQHEIEADNYALQLLVNENIDPQGLVNMLLKIPFHSVTGSTTHPSRSKRISNIVNKLNAK